MTVFRPGLCTVTFRQLSPEDVVALAAECGIVGIEWAGDVHVPHGQIDVARRVRSLTEEAGLSVVSYGSYIAPPNDDERAFATVLETAQALGAPNIRIWPGSCNWDWRLTPPPNGVRWPRQSGKWPGWPTTPPLPSPSNIIPVP